MAIKATEQQMLVEQVDFLLALEAMEPEIALPPLLSQRVLFWELAEEQMG